MNSESANYARAARSFPAVCIPDSAGEVMVEVNLIAQLGIGAGSPLIQGAATRQALHLRFVDELDEPSARLGGIRPARNDHSSLYSFVVSSKGHPFHAHAGPRMFTAISGSSGTQLRFSTLPVAEFRAAPEKFAMSLHLVDIPPDCLFSVRLGGGVWHQFASRKPKSGNPAFFALSCHPDELAGLTDKSLLAQVETGQGSIPLLTQVLPEAVQIQTARILDQPGRIRRTELYLQPPSASWRNWLCAAVRGPLGRTRMVLSSLRASEGALKSAIPCLTVRKLKTSPAGSLLDDHFPTKQPDQDDAFVCSVSDPALHGRSASDLLDELLAEFVQKPPRAITLMMMLRNALVMPLRLRRSRLGCPVSSLGDRRSSQRFANRHPVIAQRVSENGCSAQVLLGADDRHLRFRTCISVTVANSRQAEFRMCSRVECRNWFGSFYMTAIRRVHESYVSPRLLQTAVAGVITNLLPAENTGLAGQTAD